MDSPHDKLFKLVYSRPEQAAAYFEGFLPADVTARLDLARLEPVPGSFVDDELKAQHTDLLFRAPLRAHPVHAGDEAEPEPPEATETPEDDDGDEALVYLLFEHQSSVDPRMPYRLLRYMVRIWERWLEVNPNARTLPPIVPLVLYHGDRVWRAPVRFEDLVPSASGGFAPFVPRFSFLLTSLGEVSDDALAAVRDGVSRLALLMFRHARDEDIVARLAAWAEAMRQAQVLQLLAGFLEYLLSAGGPVSLDALKTTLRDSLNPQAESAAVTVAEQLIEQGTKQGQTLGLQKTLRRQLRLRFQALPAWADRAIDAATDEQLDAWLDRILTAETLEQVFAS